MRGEETSSIVFYMKARIEQEIATILTTRGFTPVNFVVEHPADLSHGDYSTNVALVLSKQMAKSPREVATELCDALKGVIPHVVKLEVAGPGFINFYLDRKFFAEKVGDILAYPGSWGKNKALQNEEIIFEYTSPNLFKPLHVGNLVGNIVGESISRLFEAGTATVHRVNYPSDIGLTVAKGVWGLTKTGGNPKDIQQIGEAYRFGNEAYERNGAEKSEIEAVNRALYAGSDSVFSSLRAEGINTSRTHLTELCRMLGTSFDKEIFESEVSDTGTQIVREHIGNVFEESEGAVIFKGERHGLHTRVFLNSQGLPTYEAKDLGNFAYKQAAYPHWTQSFVVTGAEQREYFKVLIAALREVFPDTSKKVIEHIATGFLTLTTGKMSSRKGNVLTGESLLEEMVGAALEKMGENSKERDEEENYELGEHIAVGALKYQILRQSIGSDIVFDKEKALSFEGDSGPYLMYTHARIASLERKAHELQMEASVASVPVETYALEHIMYRFPEVVAQAQQERAPHHIVVFLTELTGAFNTFYAHEKIIDIEDQFSPYKLAIAGAVRITLMNGLTLLGIKAPERM